MTTEKNNDSPNNMEWFRDSQIQFNFLELDGILACGGFNDGPLFAAAVTRALICVSDLVSKARIEGTRISITDDVQIRDGVSDLTDLIVLCRNAACHISSAVQRHESNILNWNVCRGRMPNFMNINGTILGSDYEDDIAVFFGAIRLYLGRNLLRAAAEAKTLFAGRLKY